MTPEVEDAIEIVDYDPSWNARYDQERERLLQALGDIPAELHHVGSTAVPGLAAKPIIDIMLATDDLGREEEIGRRLCPLGYVPVPIAEAGRRFFRKGMPRTHHLHLVAIGSWPYHSHLWFRDYLIQHATASEEYECLKRLLASMYRLDREGYVQGKEALVHMMLGRAAREHVLLPTFPG